MAVESVLLDTDVFSYVTSGGARAEPFRGEIEGRRACISFATVAEVYKGAFKARWARRQIDQLEQALRSFVVLPYDAELSRTCGRVMAERELSGRRLEEFDAWIAATAIRHGIPLLTNNVRHFEGTSALILRTGRTR